MRLANDTATLIARTSFDGRALELDFPGLRIGAAEYDEGPTGCTVFHFPSGATVSTDLRGGSPGVVGGYRWVDAICFAGGSLPGLEAAAGVTAELLATNDYAVGWDDIPVVSGAIIFDFRLRENSVYPDKELGRAALRAAQTNRFPLGAHGAGRNATVGKRLQGELETAGQGGAFGVFGPTKVAVFSVVNSVGVIVDRGGRVVRGNVDAAGSRRHPAPEPGNTTLTLVVTNQRLERAELDQLARQVHASMARAIHPFHTLFDGDVLYAATTGEIENPELSPLELGIVASELAWDAVLASF